MSSATHLTPVETSPRANGLASVRVVQDAVPVLDTSRFEHMQRIATLMANTSLVPTSLRGDRPEVALANCFLVTNQAVRWGLDPFAVAQCCSVVHGKLTYEGKLVAAVLDAKLGVKLKYEWAGTGDNMTVKVSGTIDGVTETIDGCVADWKTTGNGSPWTPKQYRKMLAYRGAREWARLYAPAVMLGVYADDEMERLDAAPRAVPPPAPPLRSANAQTIQPQEIGSKAALPPPAPKPGAAPDAPVAAPPAQRRAGPPSPPPAETQQAQLELDAEPKPSAEEVILNDLVADLGACGDVDTLDEVWLRFEDVADDVSRAGRETAASLYEENRKRIRGG